MMMMVIGQEPVVKVEVVQCCSHGHADLSLVLRFEPSYFCCSSWPARGPNLIQYCPGFDFWAHLANGPPM